MTVMLTYEELQNKNAELQTDVDRYTSENQELSRINNAWVNIFDAMNDAIIVVDTRYHIVRVNKAMTHVLNRPSQQLIGKKYWTVVYGQEEPVDDCPLMLAEKALGTRTKEIRDSYLGGTFLVSASLVTGEEGKLQGYCLAFKDMTDIRREQREQRHADKIEAIGTLSGAIAHEFNNLLTGIRGTVSIMMSGLDKEGPIFPKLGRMEEYIKQGHELTKQLLAFSDGESHEVETADLNALITQTWDAFFSSDKNIQSHKHLEEDLWLTDVDPGQIEHLLHHLYTNAWQAMPHGGELSIETENVVFDQTYSDFFGVPTGNYVKVVLTDTGEGIDHASQEMLFEPFFTTRPGNRGLGLAFARRIVTNHGGIINVYSEKERGATFNFYLPASVKKAQTQDKDPACDVAMGTGKVLLVDDEKIILDVGGEMLKELGYTVLVANSGAEAVEMYTRENSDIQLVILDMIMPELDGGKTYEKLREINPDVKVLLASGYSMTSRVSEIVAQGFNGFIQKPFNMVRLSKKISEILCK